MKDLIQQIDDLENEADQLLNGLVDGQEVNRQRIADVQAEIHFLKEEVIAICRKAVS